MSSILLRWCLLASLLTVGLLGTVGVEGAPTEAQTKAALLSIFGNATGSGWTTKTGWNTGAAYCTWYGVVCTTGNTNVIQLNLRHNHLVGTVPMSALAQLTELQIVDLYANEELTGSVSYELATLTKLNVFNIGKTNIGGGLESTLGTAWSQLVTFVANNTVLAGSLPVELQNWKKLQTFDVSGASIQGQLHSEFGNWTQIQILNLRDNSFTGSLPPSWASMIQLQKFSVANVWQITGDLPSEWSQLVSLEDFRAQRTRLSGDLPDSWSALTKMQHFDVTECEIGGTIPNSWFSSWSQLEVFNIAANSMHGHLPASVAFGTTIGSLDLHWNHFEGKLPSWDIKSTYSGGLYLDLSSTDVKGPIPQSWKNWTGVSEMNLGFIELQGSLPSEWGDGLQTSLRKLTLTESRVTGNLPPNWGKMTALTQLYLGENYLGGTIPAEWSGMTALQIFHMHGNWVGGTIPKFLFTSPTMDTLDLQRNSFTSIDPALSAGTPLGSNFAAIALNNNKLGGTLPEALMGPSVAFLQLHQNQFNGTLPASWGTKGSPHSANNLVILTLNSNWLTGTIPSSWGTSGGSMQHLGQLIMDHNYFYGDFPSALLGLPQLRDLLLGDNYLNGSLSTVGFPSTRDWLSVLNVSGNSLTGELPEAWGKVQGRTLQLIDFSYNRLTGTLPESWGMEDLAGYIDLSYNQLHGSIPKSWANINATKTLDLSHNQLSGGLDHLDSNLQWNNLQTLDLGYNEFTGSLPESWMAVFPDLEQLILTDNQLSGTIHPNYLGFKKLSRLELALNYLSGNLPFDEASWRHTGTKLSSLNLASNLFMGTLPEVWTYWTSLSTIILAGNYVSGTIPADWANLTLTQVDLTGNFGIEGTVPASWASSKSHMRTSLRAFSAAWSQVRGPFPTNWAKGMIGLAKLDMSGTLIQDSFPDDKFNSLTDLALDLVEWNLMSGFPTKLLSSPQLEMVSLNMCGIKGTLPKLTNSRLRMLDLRHNNIQPGPLTVSDPKKTLSNLAYLNLQPTSPTVSPSQYESDLQGIPSAKSLINTAPFVWRNPAAAPRYQLDVRTLLPVIRMPINIVGTEIDPPVVLSFLKDVKGFGVLDLREHFLGNQVGLQYKLSLSPFYVGEVWGQWGKLITVNDAGMGYIFLENYHLLARFGVNYTITVTLYIYLPGRRSADVVTIKSLPLQRQSCQPSLYAVPNSYQCIGCPANAICQGTTQLQTRGAFWAPRGDYLPLIPCAGDDGCAANVVSNGLNQTLCLNGYTGFRCASCDGGFGSYKDVRGCSFCDDVSSAVVRFLFGTLAILVTIATVWCTSPGEHTLLLARVVSTLKFLFNTFGLLGILITLNSAQKLHSSAFVPLNFEGFVGGATFFRQLFWACGLSVYDAETQIDWSFSAFLIMLSISLFPIVIKVARRPADHSIYFGVVSGLSVVLHFCFISVVVSTLRVLPWCLQNTFIPAADTVTLPSPGFGPSSKLKSITYSYLRTDPSVECPSDSATARWWTGALLVNIFYIIFLAVFALLQYRLHLKVSAELSRNVMFFYTTNYKRKYFYWEYVILTRKWLLAAMCVLPQDDQQLTFVCAVLGLSLFVHEKYRPYVSKRLHLAESLCLALAFFLACFMAMADKHVKNVFGLSVVMTCGQVLGLGGILYMIVTMWRLEDPSREEDETSKLNDSPSLNRRTAVDAASTTAVEGDSRSEAAEDHSIQRASSSGYGAL